MAYGTLSILDTLASSQQTIAQYGEDNAFAGIEQSRVAHNAIFNDMVSDFIERTTDRQRRYGGNALMDMEEVDEFGRSDNKKVAAGETVGFPLRKFDVSVQWTRDFMETATVAELAAQFTAAQEGHLRMLQRQIKRALFYPTNYTYTDRYVDNVDLAVKALVNADGAAIPPGPNGEEFDGATEDHYLARAGGSLVAADVSGVIAQVQKHWTTGEVRLYINQAQEAAIRAMTSNFTPYVDMRIMPGADTTVARGSLNQSNMYNRAIGIFDAAEVWVKPWIPASYMFSFVKGAPVPLVMRERMAGRAGLRLVAENEYHPLRTETLMAEFGVGVWTRNNGAVLYTGDTTYAAPTIT